MQFASLSCNYAVKPNRYYPHYLLNYSNVKKPLFTASLCHILRLLFFNSSASFYYI